MLAAESAGAVHLFDLESPVDLTRLSNPELVLRSLEGLIVLDEVQRRPDLFPLLRVLAGRVSFVDVTGFSLSELGASSLSRLWWRSGFPRAWLAADDTTARQWHEDFFRTFLEHDIPQLGVRVPAATLPRHPHRHLCCAPAPALVREPPEAPGKVAQDLRAGFRHSPRAARYRQPSGLAGTPETRGVVGRVLRRADPEPDGRSQRVFLGHSQRGGTRPATTKSMRIAQQDLSFAHLCIVHPAEQSYPLDESITATPLPELLRILHTGADQ